MYVCMYICACKISLHWFIFNQECMHIAHDYAWAFKTTNSGGKKASSFHFSTVKLNE